MKFVLVFHFLVAALLTCNALTKVTRNKVQQISQVAKRVIKGIPVKGKAVPLQKTQWKGVRPKQIKASNAKRWVPAKKNSVKYVPKIANNKKRWMPGFAEMGQNEMESSMMFDTGFVSSDPPSSFQGGQQSHAGPFGLPQPETSQQALPPEQSFLTPGTNDQVASLPGQAAGHGQYNQYQSYGNEIESFTKEGLDGVTNSLYNNFDGFQDNSFNNPKFQEGDFIGVPMSDSQEGKQANLYDAFNLEPGMAENFVNPGKDISGTGQEKKEESKDEKEKDDQKEENEKEEDKAKEKNKPKEGKKGDNKEGGKATKVTSGNQKEAVESKDEKEVQNNKDSEKETKGKGNKSGKSEKSGKSGKVSAKEEKNIKASGKEEKGAKAFSKEETDDKAAEKEEKDVQVSGKEEKDVQVSGKEEKGAKAFNKEETDDKASGKEEKLESTDVKEKNVNEKESNEETEKVEAKAKEVEVAAVEPEKNVDEETGKESLGGSEKGVGPKEKEASKAKAGTNQKEEKEDDKKQKDNKSRKVAKKIKKVQKEAKNIEKDAQEEKAEQRDTKANKQLQNEENDNEQQPRIANSNDNQEVANAQEPEQKEASSTNLQEGQASESKEEDTKVANGKEEGKSTSSVEEEKRIKKLKQRINSQKSRTHARLQQDAAERQKIIEGGVMADNSLISNVGPANKRLGLAAEGLRKQLVSNLRHALMRNVAAAIAKGTTANIKEENKSGQGQGLVQNMGGQEAERADAALKQESEPAGGKPSRSDEQSNFQNGGQANAQENEAGAKDDGNQASGNKGGNGGSDQTLVPTLMKMDKPMLVDTILKLLNKKQGNTNNKNDEKQATEANEKEEKVNKNGGTINQSFSNQGETPSDAVATVGMTGHATDQEAGGEQKPGEGEATDVTEAKGEESSAKATSGAKEESGHAEYAAVPVKSTGDTKFYKFKKVRGLGQIKGKLGHQQDDPYSQIGLVDPANNDKMPAHHKASNLKEDLDKQQEKVSKFAKNGNDGGSEVTDSNGEGGGVSKETPDQSQENAEPVNQESNQSSQKSETNGDQEADQQQQQSGGNQAQGKANQEQQSGNDNSDQVSNKEASSNHKTDQDAPIQQTQVQQQPDGGTTVTNINADSPKMVAQLLKISQRLHEINDKKEQSQQKVSDDQPKTITNAFTFEDMPSNTRDDAYATIGSLDPNVKKKAAIGKKKTVISKEVPNKQSSDNITVKQRTGRGLSV